MNVPCFQDSAPSRWRWPIFLGLRPINAGYFIKSWTSRNYAIFILIEWPAVFYIILILILILFCWAAGGCGTHESGCDQSSRARWAWHWHGWLLQPFAGGRGLCCCFCLRRGHPFARGLLHRDLQIPPHLGHPCHLLCVGHVWNHWRQVGRCPEIESCVPGFGWGSSGHAPDVRDSPALRSCRSLSYPTIFVYQDRCYHVSCIPITS